MRYIIFLSILLFFISKPSICQVGTYTGKYDDTYFTLELNEVYDRQLGMGTYYAYKGEYENVSEKDKISSFYWRVEPDGNISTITISSSCGFENGLIKIKGRTATVYFCGTAKKLTKEK
jgi:hypothetical protein